MRNTWAASWLTAGACSLWSLFLFLALPLELVSHFLSSLKRSSLENASQGAVFIDFQGLSEQNCSMYLQRCFSLTADSIYSPWVLKVKLFFFWFRSCWGFKPSGQILLLEMLWMPLDHGSPCCRGAHGLHSSRIPPLAYLWQGQRGIYSHLFLQGD